MYFMGVKGYNMDLPLEFFFLWIVRKIKNIFHRAPFVFAVINNLIDQNNILNKIEGLPYLLIEMLPTWFYG